MNEFKNIKKLSSKIFQKSSSSATAWWKKLHAKGKLEIGAIPYAQNEIMSYIPKID